MSSSAATGRGTGARSARTRLEQWAARFESPMTTYYLLLGVVGLLVGIGLVMVLSASMIVSLRENDSSFTIFLKQFVFAVAGAGAVVGLAAERRLLEAFRPARGPRLHRPARTGPHPLGFGFQGNRNWIGVGSLSIQPSEIAKIGLVLGGALVLERKQALLGSIKHALIPFVVPGALVIVGLVMLGHDLGTAMVIVAIVVGMLFAAGVPLRWFGAGLGVLAVLGYAALTLGNSRMERINVWLNPEQCAPGTELFYGICRQSVHGRYALADGGWLGVGLGASREKWGWLSEPYNDFIFAIIGEELGLLGTLAILLLFASFALAGLRLVTRTDDYFVRLATAGICTWVLIQAIINIGAVIGMLPVIGVPLPFVSSGGSSLVTSMLAVGILLSFARAEPGCSEMIAAKPSRARALLARFPSRRTSTR
ncbi:putative lipid II flippase FtsW [Janibacter hoylei]|uniref:FtsW/RodA/SpoVE family cell cycle protein n=1 Tax=Janibacter hoylei TaxID=364298 RepID=UPI0022372DFF|nr:putative peptidoglycan glycosyltransferase FtsW [Janibacter hoylei]MCW4602860.1 putative lipid II flippase FtsW [Janibacter hoylei]